jgi:cobalt-zinc-cadmium resistance protein CzcA
MTVWREFLPQLDEGSIWLHAEMPAGISLDKAAEMTAELRRAVSEFPEVSTVVTHLGRNDDGTDPWTPSHVEAAVGLHSYDSWPAGETKQGLVERIAARLDQLPGLEVAFSQPIIDGVLDKVFDPHSALTIKVVGDDFDALRRIGKDIVAVLNTIPGVTDAAIDQYTLLPQIAIEVDRVATARYGINVADVADLIRTGIGGDAVSQVFIGERHYDMTVRFPPEVRNSPEAIKDLVLTSSSGALVPLSQLANVHLQTGESMINREMNHRYLAVKLDYRDRDPAALVAEVDKRIADKVSFDHSKFHLAWGGQLEGQQRAEARFKLIVSLVLGLMMALLYAEFGLLRQVLLILSIVPLATLGGLIALRLTGTTLNVASGVGFIALSGVAIMNGVIMVANLNRVCRHDMPLLDAVLSGAGERLRPVLMTASVATFGMLPAALATGVGSDVQRSLAIVVAGGLIPATLLTLFIIPTFYYVIERRAARRAAVAAPATERGLSDA